MGVTLLMNVYVNKLAIHQVKTLELNLIHSWSVRYHKQPMMLGRRGTIWFPLFGVCSLFRCCSYSIQSILRGQQMLCAGIFSYWQRYCILIWSHSFQGIWRSSGIEIGWQECNKLSSCWSIAVKQSSIVHRQPRVL